jgi:hypothetical protein
MLVMGFVFEFDFSLRTPFIFGSQERFGLTAHGLQLTAVHACRL